MVNKEAFDLTKRKETVQNLLAITRGKNFLNRPNVNLFFHIRCHVILPQPAKLLSSYYY